MFEAVSYVKSVLSSKPTQHAKLRRSESLSQYVVFKKINSCCCHIFLFLQWRHNSTGFGQNELGGPNPRTLSRCSCRRWRTSPMPDLWPEVCPEDIWSAHQDLWKSDNKKTKSFWRSKKETWRFAGCSGNPEEWRVRQKETGQTRGRVPEVSALFKKFWSQGKTF